MYNLLLPGCHQPRFHHLEIHQRLVNESISLVTESPNLAKQIYKSHSSKQTNKNKLALRQFKISWAQCLFGISLLICALAGSISRRLALAISSDFEDEQLRPNYLILISAVLASAANINPWPELLIHSLPKWDYTCGCC